LERGKKIDAGGNTPQFLLQIAGHIFRIFGQELMSFFFWLYTAQKKKSSSLNVTNVQDARQRQRSGL
jgi:hypothetical protein